MKKKLNLPILIVVGLTIIGAFLRLYRLPQTMMFQGDQGRDAIIVKRLIIDQDPILIGPVTSVGNMYLGPFYYYFMAPFLALTYPSPVGPAIGVAIVSIISLPLLYFFTKDMFDQKVALITLFLYTFMSKVVFYSRFSWNPNLAPVMSMIIMWCLYKAIKTQKYKWFVGASLAFGILTQMHYMALIMGGVVVVGVLLAWWRNRSDTKSILIWAILSLLIYGLTFLPLVIFDLRHDQLIRNAFVEFLTGQDQYIQPATKIVRILKETEGKSFMILAQLIKSQNGIMDRVIVYGSLVVLLLLLVKKKVVLKKNDGLVLVLLSLLISVLGAAIYASTVFDHYIIFVAPMVAMFFGFLLWQIWQIHKLGRLVVIGILTIFMYLNWTDLSFLTGNTPMYSHFQDVVETITPHISSGKYNIALLSESKDYKGMNYRYFFEVSGHPPESIDNYSDLDQLIIIDEQNVQQPLQTKIFEIETPNLKHVANSFNLPNGPTVYIMESDTYDN